MSKTQRAEDRDTEQDGSSEPTGPEPERAEPVLPEGRVARVVAHGRKKARRAAELLQRPRPPPEAGRVQRPEEDPALPPLPGRQQPGGGRPAPRAGQHDGVPRRETEPVHVGVVGHPRLGPLGEDGHVVSPPHQAGDLIQKGRLGEHREFAGEHRDPHSHRAPSTSVTCSISASVV